MVLAERITQFDPYLEVASLRRGVKPEAVLEQIIHTFAEFACNIKLTDYHYIQTPDNQLLAPGREPEDILNSFQRGITSRRTFQEYQSFANLREKILETIKPSVAITFSPPGPKSEGYGDYGFFYLALIPRYTLGENRRISMLALRINNFDRQTSLNTLKFIRMLAPEIPRPEGKTLEEKLLQACVVLPIGKKEKIKTIPELFALIGITLNRNFGQEEISDGLTNRALRKVYEKFKLKIYEIYTNIWLASQGLPAETNGERLFQGVDINLLTGGCPTASTSQELSPSSEAGKELHWCPLCGIWFTGNQCPCGYRI